MKDEAVMITDGEKAFVMPKPIASCVTWIFILAAIAIAIVIATEECIEQAGITICN